MTDQDEKDLNKALNLSMFSLVGWIVPIVGLALAVVATRLAHGVDDDSRAAKNKKGLIQGMAIVGALLSFAAGYLYYDYYAGLRTEAENRVKQEQHTQAQQQSDAANKKLSLDSCIAQADHYYTQYLEINSTNTTTDASGQKIYYMPQQNWDYINGKQKQDKDECYRRYQ